MSPSAKDTAHWRLILFGFGENATFAIRRELTEKSQGLKTVACIGDVRDEAKVRRMFVRGARKRFPCGHPQVRSADGENPDEVVTNNVFGRLTVARAVEVGVERFVLISMDKAINPVTCMGASKRLADMIVQGMSRGRPVFRALARSVAASSPMDGPRCITGL